MSLEKEFEENMELRVLLLALYKKEESESFKDILLTLENSRLFTLKEGKKFLKLLKELQYINDEGFTMLGVQKAGEVEMEFKV
jgi:hypothetical protein